MNDETPFIEAILANPEDEAPRLIYADWLEERGDPRGEFLRVENALANLTRGNARGPALRDRLKQLRQSIGDEWPALVDRTPIEGCVRFAFECPKQWDQLRRTDDPLARSCEACRREVYHCSSVEQALRHAARGHCVAIDSRLTRTKGDLESGDFYGYGRRSRERQGELRMTLGIVAPPAPTYRVGDHVEITAGQLKGRRGNVKEVRMSLLRATVQLAGEPTCVEVDFDNLEYSVLRGRRR